MSDQNAGTTEAATLEAAEDHLQALKDRAEIAGMTFHPKIKAVTLEKNLKAFVLKQKRAQSQVIPQQSEAQAEPRNTPPKTATPEGLTAKESNQQMRMRKVKEATRLVRCRVVCMNPNKKDWEGEIFSVSNAIVPTIKKYIPFNAEDGWHIPQMMLNMLQERKCQLFRTVKGPRGNKIRQGYLINEFNIEMLDALTKPELADLAKQQAIANNLD